MTLLEAQEIRSVVQTAEKPLIVQVTRQFLPNRGGLEDVIANLSRQLIKRGYRVRVVTCNSLFTDRETILPARETIDGIEVVRIAWSGSTRYPIGPAVFSHIRDADLVHVHAVDFFFDALAWGKLLHGRRMVATTHGGFFHTPKFAAIKKTWFNTVTRLSASAYRSVIGCSESDYRLFSQIAANRSVLIENGADTVKFADAASSTPLRRIVTIGRFSVNKRLERLLDVMAVLADRNPEWHLDIIGAVSDLDGDDLAAEIARRNLQDRVDVHISLENADIRRIISRASIFASASEYEGFGLVAIEAMSAGLLPILNTNDAYRTLAGRHDPIVLTDFSNPDVTADVVAGAYDRLASEGNAIRPQLLSAARAYSWDSVADRYVAVYQDAMRGN